ncbi:MAG: prepilin-type N-terminal cleavage/methylation domain-containing protein [Verrucomicrobiae bacterium]
MARPPIRVAGYTLLEVLLALGIIAVLVGVSVPYLANSFGKTDGEEIADAIAGAAQSVRTSAAEQNEARRIAIQENGVFPEIESVPPVRLPKGWKLEVRRMTDSRFRKPEKTEFWGFNSAGICEPLTLRISGGKESLEMAIDPLTGLVLEE